MEFRIYDPARGTIPPHIENSRLTINKLPCKGGRDIEYYRDTLCLIDYDNGGTFRLLNPDRPESPLAELSGLGNLRQIEVSEIRNRIIAAVTARENGLWLIDMTDRTSPFVVCHYDSVEFATGVTFCGKYLFVGCRSFGVEIIDISSPERPRHVSSIRAGEVQSIKVSDGLLFTGSWGEREINVIDVSDPKSPRHLSRIEVDGRTDGICVHGKLLFAAFGQHLRPDPGYSPDEYGYGRGNGFSIYDISDPERPEKLSRTLFPHRYYCCERDMWDVTISSRYAIVSHTFNGVWIYDVSDPKAPVLVDYIGVTTDKKLGEMITITDQLMKTRPPIIPFDYEKVSYAPVAGVAVGYGRLWVAADFSELVEAHGDYFTPEASKAEKEPVEHGENFYLLHPGQDIPEDAVFVRNIGQAHSVTELDGRFFAACGNEGIKCFDSGLHELFEHRIEPFVRDIRAFDGKLYAAAGDSGIYILEADSGGLRTIGNFCMPGMTCAQVIPTGRFLMAHADDQRLCIIDAADPENMRLALSEKYFPGLVYYRQMTENGSGGKYFGCWWNGNYTRWYDLSGSEPVRLENVQGRLNFRSGVTGLSEEYKALAICCGGYVIHDIRGDFEYSDRKVIRIPGVRLSGKPKVFGEILTVSDRIDGNVTVCDISSPESPVLLFSAKFNGHPDILQVSGGNVYIPLGHQGICAVRLDLWKH